jgi:hypothetical protein
MKRLREWAESRPTIERALHHLAKKGWCGPNA